MPLHMPWNVQEINQHNKRKERQKKKKIYGREDEVHTEQLKYGANETLVIE